MSQPLGVFQPRGAQGTTPAATTNIAVTASVQQLALPSTTAESTTMRLTNSGTQTVFWSYGAASGLTVSNGVPVLANTVEEFTVPGGVSQISVIASATGSTLYATLGDGQ
ncbi:hypothetical protein [Burkholderia glumae]|uniref:hypothetical protein n=1 Tax=Burkholderia glumae TaxID=337 RepID=UPI00215122BB|nr:hypothetical protein [Burkholderia glumae]